MVRRTEPPVPPTPPDDGGGITHPGRPTSLKADRAAVRCPVTGVIRRLGRIQPKTRPVALRLGAYLRPRANPPPDAVDYSRKAAPSLQRMYKNDQLGCCVVSGKAHLLGVWSANDSDSGGIILATDEEIVSQYHSICGPGDEGCVITDVLDVMRAKGFRAGGRTYKIDGYCAIDNRSKPETQVALLMFGGLTVGMALPRAWHESHPGAVWDVTDSDIVGGHDVTVCGYGPQGALISSWGQLFTITWAAFTARTWVNELYVILAPSWYGNDKLAPNGLDVIALQADLAKLANGVIPDVGPPPGPNPPPPVPPPNPDPPPPGPGPEPAEPLFHLTFSRNVKSGQRVRFTARTAIPAGVYDVTPAPGRHARRGVPVCEAKADAGGEEPPITPARPRRR